MLVGLKVSAQQVLASSDLEDYQPIRDWGKWCHWLDGSWCRTLPQLRSPGPSVKTSQSTLPHHRERPPRRYEFLNTDLLVRLTEQTHETQEARIETMTLIRGSDPIPILLIVDQYLRARRSRDPRPCRSSRCGSVSCVFPSPTLRRPVFCLVLWPVLKGTTSVPHRWKVPETFDSKSLKKIIDPVKMF